jgi:hypothetical protein
LLSVGKRPSKKPLQRAVPQCLHTKNKHRVARRSSLPVRLRHYTELSDLCTFPSEDRQAQLIQKWST